MMALSTEISDDERGDVQLGGRNENSPFYAHTCKT
jgi:hypothetical protein